MFPPPFLPIFPLSYGSSNICGGSSAVSVWPGAPGSWTWLQYDSLVNVLAGGGLSSGLTGSGAVAVADVGAAAACPLDTYLCIHLACPMGT